MNVEKKAKQVDTYRTGHVSRAGMKPSREEPRLFFTFLFFFWVISFISFLWSFVGRTLHSHAWFFVCREMGWWARPMFGLVGTTLLARSLLTASVAYACPSNPRIPTVVRSLSPRFPPLRHAPSWSRISVSSSCGSEFSFAGPHAWNSASHVRVHMAWSHLLWWGPARFQKSSRLRAFEKWKRENHQFFK